MCYTIDTVGKSEYADLIEVWEASVRATHHFLKEEDIEFYRTLLLNENLEAVDLRGVRNDRHVLVGFLGVAGRKIEMLFIHPEVRGKGIGKLLLTYAIEELKVNKVDVNEDNKQAIGFYEHAGFKTVGRSNLDSMGKSYPILYMALDEPNKQLAS